MKIPLFPNILQLTKFVKSYLILPLTLTLTPVMMQTSTILHVLGKVTQHTGLLSVESSSQRTLVIPTSLNLTMFMCSLDMASPGFQLLGIQKSWTRVTRIYGSFLPKKKQMDYYTFSQKEGWGERMVYETSSSYLRGCDLQVIQLVDVLEVVLLYVSVNFLLQECLLY